MRVGIVGCGNMGGAIASGIREAGLVEADDLVLVDTTVRQAEELADAIGAAVATDLDDLLARLKRGIVVLAVKPHAIEAVAAALAEAAGANLSDLTVVSVAAGVSLKRLGAALGEGANAVRVMPNVAARVRQAMTAIAFPAALADEARGNVVALFEAIGEVLVLDEAHFSAYSALGGCSPAWLAATADAYAQAAVAQGLTKAQAMAAITQAMAGTAELLKSLSGDPAPAARLVDQVCSPAGTTVAGLLALEDGGMRAAAHAAVDAAVRRDLALGED